jgi:hypothetical protein
MGFLSCHVGVDLVEMARGKALARLGCHSLCARGRGQVEVVSTPSTRCYEKCDRVSSITTASARAPNRAAGASQVRATTASARKARSQHRLPHGQAVEQCLAPGDSCDCDAGIGHGGRSLANNTTPTNTTERRAIRQDSGRWLRQIHDARCSLHNTCPIWCSTRHSYPSNTAIRRSQSAMYESASFSVRKLRELLDD